MEIEASTNTPVASTSALGLTVSEQLGLISEADYATFRKIKVRALRKEREKGKGPPFVKQGRHVWYRRADILKFFAKNATDPAKRAPTLTEARRPTRRSRAR